MITLLQLDADTPALPNATSFGGHPYRLAGSALSWPTCGYCSGEMQYLGKIVTDLGLEQLFMCQNDPGMCSEWEAGAGGNQVVIVPHGPLEAFAPEDPEAGLRKTEYTAQLVGVDAPDYFAALETYEAPPRSILGQLYGEPKWYQGNQTPNCDCCGNEMRFVAQLEEGPDYRTAMNFGGGIAYLFDCPVGRTGKFLWQC